MMKRLLIILVLVFALRSPLSAQFQVELPRSRSELKMLEMEIKKGDAAAMFRMGYAYMYGVPGVLSRNQARGKSWLEKSADAGFADACLLLQKLYPYNDKGYADRAERLYRAEGTGYAYYCLAELYKANVQECIRYLLEAKKKGYAPADAALAQMMKTTGARTDEVAASSAEKPQGESVRPVKRQPVVVTGTDEVDTDIPINKRENSQAFAVIIGNESYQDLPAVPYALNDAKSWAAYCRYTLGIPQDNIRVYPNATFAQMISAVAEIRNVMVSLDGEASLLFYYAGHGQPDQEGKKVYLVPVDGSPTFEQSWYPMEKLYAELGKLPVKNATVFLDACFSGAQRNGEMLTRGRSLAVSADVVAPEGNTIVFSAAAANETAHPFEAKGHGMFTYFLLKKLQETEGDVTLGDLADYLIRNVRQQSALVNKRIQTPSVIPSLVVEGTDWRSIRLGH